MNILTIVQEPKKRPKSEEETKTREFSLTLLASIEADSLWDGGRTVLSENGTSHGYNSPHRPVFLLLAGTPGEATPFLANFMRGRSAYLHDHDNRYRSNSASSRYEILKTAGFTKGEQKGVGSSGESVFTIFLGELFEISPGLLDKEEDVRFVTPPLPFDKAEETLHLLNDEQREDVLAYARNVRLLDAEASLLGIPNNWSEQALLELVPRAMHCAACLSGRIFHPFPVSPSFCLHLYLSGLRHGIFSLPHKDGGRWGSNVGDGWDWARHQSSFPGFQAQGLREFNFLDPVACHASHQQITDFLSEQIQFFTQFHLSM